jgi:two-component system, NarL family, response regulator YdfI
MMIRVLIVATAAVVRAGLSAALATNAGIVVVGTANDLDLLGEEVDRCQPDVILIDLGDSPQHSAWEKLHVFRAAFSSIPIALYDWEGDFATALGAGVAGILPDTSTEAELCGAIMAIANGWLVIHPTAMNLATPEKIVINPVRILTAREIEVLIQIGAGLANKAIAQNLHISEHTVKFHLSSIFQKLDVSTRTEAVTAGIRMGLILL